MNSEQEFIDKVDSRFYKYLIKETLLSFQKVPKRKIYLQELFGKISSSVKDYKPKPPRDYISTPKTKYVVRMVPSFDFEENIIYYYSIKVLEDYLVENRCENTYGGFRLGGKFSKSEDSDFEVPFSESINENSFNKYAWKSEYSNYQKKIKDAAQRMGSEFNYAILFDIANFYDSIRIDLLEEKIKYSKNIKEFKDEIHLLSCFLKYWKNNKVQNTVGLPQDDIGESSRILSNFFLQDYDLAMQKICSANNSLYVRYADDQIIFSKTSREIENIMYDSSLKLNEKNLNINSGKIKIFYNYQDFDDCFGFSIFSKLAYDNQDVNDAFDMFIYKKQNCRYFRESSVLKKLLNKNININQLKNQKRIKFLSYLWDEDFLLFANNYYLMRIYEMLRTNEEKDEYIETLVKINSETKFKSFQLNFNKFIIEKNRLDFKSNSDEN